MQEMTISQSLSLLKSHSSPCLSIYLNTATLIQGSQALTELKKRLTRLLSSLLHRHALSPKYSSISTLAKGVLSAVARSDIRQKKGGLAIFHNNEFTGIVYLPTPTKDFAIVAKSFHFKPVLKCLQSIRPYYVLNASFQKATLIHVELDGFKIESNVNRFSFDQMTRPGPLKEFDFMRNPSQWVHCFMNAFEQKDHLQRAPSITVASSQRLIECIKHRNRSFSLIQESMIGKVDRFNDSEIVEMTSPILQNYFLEREDFEIQLYEKAILQGLTASSIKNVAFAASQGQIERLFIAEDAHIFGEFNRLTGDIKLTTNTATELADDLLDDIAELCVLQRKPVRVLPLSKMPNQVPIAAILKSDDSIFSKQELGFCSTRLLPTLVF